MRNTLLMERFNKYLRSWLSFSDRSPRTTIITTTCCAMSSMRFHTSEKSISTSIIGYATLVIGRQGLEPNGMNTTQPTVSFWPPLWRLLNHHRCQLLVSVYCNVVSIEIQRYRVTYISHCVSVLKELGSSQALIFPDMV